MINYPFHCTEQLMTFALAAGYLNMIHQMKQLVSKAGKKAYTIVVGRPNPAKLANFPEVDEFYVYHICVVGIN